MADIKTWKKDFLASRKKEDEDPAAIAQRFINIYRQLPILGEEAVNRFNQILITQASDEVLIALTGLPGGEEIREYINFVQNRDLEDREELTTLETQTAELPKAEELSPLWETMGAGCVSSMVQPIVQEVVQPAAPAPSTRELERAKRQVLSVIQRQNEDISSILKYIIIDSDTDKMQETLNTAISKITRIQDGNVPILESLLDQPVSDTGDTQPTEPAQKKPTSSKPVFTAAAKNKRIHPTMKYSVDLIEEEDGTS